MTNRTKRDQERLDKLSAEVRDLKRQLKQIPAETDLLRKENQRLRRRAQIEGGAVDLIVHTVQEVMNEWEFEMQLPPRLEMRGRPKGDNHTIAVAHVTDVQLGKVTESYDSAVAEMRLMHYAQQVVSCVRNHHKADGVKDLHVYFGGDMIEGELIFPHQAHQIDSSVFEQACITAPRVLSAMLLYWSSYFSRVKVFCVRGNHGRPASKHAGSHPRTNWDSVCYEVTKLMTEKGLLQAKRPQELVEFHISPSWYIIDNLFPDTKHRPIRNLLIHGDTGIRGSLGFPWYGLQKKMAGWIDSIPEPWDNVFLGHFHQYVAADWNGRLWYCGGTPESDNEFARAELAATGRPKQRFMLWNEEHGPIVELPIYLDEGTLSCKGRHSITA